MSDTKLHWYCWIHDEPEECVEGACEFGYWLCPECKGGMEYLPDGEEKPYGGPWYCGECEVTVHTELAAAHPNAGAVEP